jgi:hypothetical protein
MFLTLLCVDMAGAHAQSLPMDSVAVGGTEDVSIRSLRQDLLAYRTKLRTIKSARSQQWVIVDLLILLQRTVHHETYARNSSLQSLRARTVSVLRSEQKRLALEARRLAKNNSTTISSISGTEDGSAESHWLDQWNARQSHHANAAIGGPLSTLGFLPGNRGPGFDYQSLIDLIEVSIQPDVWRVHGGDGTISAYDPAVAIVVFAPWSVQDEIEDLLIMLR